MSNLTNAPFLPSSASRVCDTVKVALSDSLCSSVFQRALASAIGHRDECELGRLIMKAYKEYEEDESDE